MSFVYMPFDMFLKPVAEDQEVWFGVLFEGWAAKLTEPLHWAIYAAGCFGFWRMRPWMWPWASVYALQVAVSMLVWNVMRDALLAGSISFAVFMIPTTALYRSRSYFTGD
jgi:hypothetical protein|tara:strand:- start:3758 stop:4087 length:330 start_codon:yes stop_codon:yes gene_type:complete